jgi:hypothetical protein
LAQWKSISVRSVDGNLLLRPLTPSITLLWLAVAEVHSQMVPEAVVVVVRAVY